MIADITGNASLYFGISKNIETALKYLTRTDFADLPVGRMDIEGDSLYAMIQRYDTRPRDSGVWEAHRKYIDVQYVVSGKEYIGWEDINRLQTAAPYDEAKDAELLSGDGNMLLCRAGTFMILFPGDAHMPCISAGAAERILKVVVKIRIS